MIYLKWSYGNSNWGDLINPYVASELSGERVVNILTKKSRPLKALQRIRKKPKPEFSVIGSILGWSDWRDDVTEIWGSGVIDPSWKMNYKPRKVHAVRGPYSADWLKSFGIECPQVYGDPGLLMPQITGIARTASKYKLGIIPHYVDLDNLHVNRLVNESEGVHLISPLMGREDFMREVAQCEAIASSSLHGVILADSLGIANVWVQFSNRVIGSGFKFRDYFAGARRTGNNEVYSVDDRSTCDNLLSLCELAELLDFEDALLSTCPFLKK